MWRFIFLGFFALAAVGILMSIGGGVSLALDDELTDPQRASKNWVMFDNESDHRIELVELGSLTHHSLPYAAHIEGITPSATMLRIVGDDLYFYDTDERRVYRMALTGEEAPKLVSTTLPSGVFSPDAQWVYYYDSGATFGDGMNEIFRASLNGLTTERLSHTFADGFYTDPIFNLSPNGEWIAYRTVAISSGRLNLMRADGTDLHEAIHLRLESVKWSTDSQWLAVTYGTAPAPIGAALYNISTHEVRNLSLESWQFQGELAISPNADKVIFAGQCGDMSRTVTCLFETKANSTTSEELFRLEGTVRNLRYSPSGEWLTFTLKTDLPQSHYGHDNTLYLVRPDGTDLQSITTTYDDFLPLHHIPNTLTLAIDSQNDPALPRLVIMTGFGFIFGGIMGGFLARKVHLARTAPKIKTKRPYFVDA